MKCLRRLSVAVIALFGMMVAGCNVVGFEEPVGVPAGEAAKLAGVWVNPQGVVFVKHEGGPNFKVALVQEDEEQTFKLEKISGQLGRLEEHFIVNLRFKHENKPYWGIAHIAWSSDDELVMFPVQPETVRELVSDGLLKGSVDSGEHGFDVLVTDKPERVNKVLKHHYADLWVFDQPTVYERLSDWPVNPSMQP